jgi:hypothetical protein
LAFNKGVPYYGLRVVCLAENTPSVVEFFVGDEESKDMAGYERVVDEICGD